MKIKEGGGMDIQEEREAFECEFKQTDYYIAHGDLSTLMLCDDQYALDDVQVSFEMWQAAKAQAVPEQLDVNSILHDIDCYFDNGLSNTERAANNLLQSIYEKLSGEVKAQEPTND